MNHIWSLDGENHFKNEDENESSFEERVFGLIKKQNTNGPQNCKILFGDNVHVQG